VHRDGDWFQSYWYGELGAGYSGDEYCDVLLHVLYAHIWKLLCDGDGW
jgi:hypothetical protein